MSAMNLATSRACQAGDAVMTDRQICLGVDFHE